MIRVSSKLALHTHSSKCDVCDVKSFVYIMHVVDFYNYKSIIHVLHVHVFSDW